MATTISSWENNYFSCIISVSQWYKDQSNLFFSKLFQYLIKKEKDELKETKHLRNKFLYII